MEIHEIEAAVEAIVFASGEPVSIDRIAAVLAVDRQIVIDTADRLSDEYSAARRGIRLLKLENSLQMCSSSEYSDIIRLVLEARKPPQLSPTALEVLSVVAYYQPVTRAYVDQIRGVDSSYTVGMLAERGLIEPCGRLAVPGRPVLYRTTKTFLRVFGISSLEQLPELPTAEADPEGQLRIKNAIEALRAAETVSEEQG